MTTAKSSTASNVLDILLLFDHSTTELSAEEISVLIDTTRSTTYRYLRTLLDKGFLEKTPGGKYCLGPYFVKLGRVANRKTDIGRIALPVMEHIVEETKETVLLTRRSGRYSVCIERVEGSHAVRISFEKGHIQPLHAGASSKILLAYAGDEARDDYFSQPLEGFTAHTITDPVYLEKQLDEIRRQGYCVSHGEVDEDAVAVSVPIFDAQGRLIAALSLAGPAFRMDAAVIQSHLEALRTGVKDIEAQLP